MKAVLKWTLRSVAALLILLILAVAIFIIRDRVMYADFYKMDEKGMKIPGLWEGYVSQGFDWYDEKGVYLTCGYHKDGEASRIYILDGEEQIRVDLKKEDGSDYTEHTSGIDTYGKYIYIASVTRLDLFLTEDVFDGDGKATRVDTVPTFNDPAYCTVVGDTLYAGSFYHPGSYETPAEHRIKTPAGDQNMAVMSVYPLNPETGKPASDTPSMIYSTTSQIQGMTFVDENVMVLASSYGLATSNLRFYDLSKVEATDVTLTVNDTEVPVRFLDSASLIETVEAPPMAEEIAWKDGKLWVMNESACTKYWFGKLTTGNHVRGISLPVSVTAVIEQK